MDDTDQLPDEEAPVEDFSEGEEEEEEGEVKEFNDYSEDADDEVY